MDQKSPIWRPVAISGNTGFEICDSSFLKFRFYDDLRLRDPN